MVQAKAPNHRQGDLREAALTFAELAGTYLAWERILRSPDMGESQYLNGVRERSRNLGELDNQRRTTLELLAIKFPGQASPEVVQLIEHQESMDVLRDWFRALARATTYDEFLAVLQR